MDDLELIKKRLFAMPDDELVGMADESGVPYGTLWNIKHKKTKNPRWDTFKLLRAHYARVDGARPKRKSEARAV